MVQTVSIWRQFSQLYRSLRDASKHIKLTVPKDGRFEIPASLIPLESDAGQGMLGKASTNNVMLGTVQKQEHPAFCGIAAAVTVAHASAQTCAAAAPGRVDAEQHCFFEAFRRLQHTPPLFTHFGFGVLDLLPTAAKFPLLEFLKYDGLPLAVLADWFRALEFLVEVVDAGHSDEATLRKDIAAAFSQVDASENDRRRYIMANYSRLKLGQKRFSGGHYAPLGGVMWDEDRVLLLEVNQWRYPSVWVEISTLWNALHTQAGNGSWRGYLKLEDTR